MLSGAYNKFLLSSKMTIMTYIFPSQYKLKNVALICKIFPLKKTKPNLKIPFPGKLAKDIRRKMTTNGYLQRQFLNKKS